MATCEFCEKESKITWKTASLSLYDIVNAIQNEDEEEAVERLAKLLNMLKNRKFDVENTEFVKIKLFKNEYVRTCDNEPYCNFWLPDGIAENDVVDKILDFSGLLIEW